MAEQLQQQALTMRGSLKLSFLLCLYVGAISFSQCEETKDGTSHDGGNILHSSSRKPFKHVTRHIPFYYYYTDTPPLPFYYMDSPSISSPPYGDIISAPSPSPSPSPPSPAITGGFCIYPPTPPAPPSVPMATPIQVPLPPPPPPPFYSSVPSLPPTPPQPAIVIPRPPTIIPSPSTPVPSAPLTLVPMPPGQLSAPTTPIFVPSPPAPVPSAPIYVPSPPESSVPVYMPPPPKLRAPAAPALVPTPPEAPTFVPSPPQFAPPPPIFLPPVVYPSGKTPPSPLATLPGVWCVVKPTVPDPIIQEAMDYACGSGADCDSIMPGGPCYLPNTLIAHASYAFNSYWQRTKVAGGTCDFGGTAMLITKDPSYDGCHYKLL